MSPEIATMRDDDNDDSAAVIFWYKLLFIRTAPNLVCIFLI